MQRIFFSLLLLSSCVMHPMEYLLHNYFGQNKISRAYVEAKKSDIEKCGKLDQATALWVKKEIIPGLSDLSLVDAHSTCNKISPDAFGAYLRHGDTQSSLPMVLFGVLPDDAEKTLAYWLFDGNVKAMETFNAFAAKHTVGKALLYRKLVYGVGKGIPGLSKARSFEILCDSADAYIMCKRLIPVFQEQHKQSKLAYAQIHRVRDAQEWNATPYQEKWVMDVGALKYERSWKKNKNICVSTHELELLKRLPHTVKEQIQHFYVRTPLPLYKKIMPAIALMGSMSIPPILLGTAILERIDNFITGTEQSVMPFNNAFNRSYRFGQHLIENKIRGFNAPMSIREAIPGFVDGEEIAE
jgi:hypothetical protein